MTFHKLKRLVEKHFRNLDPKEAQLELEDFTNHLATEHICYENNLLACQKIHEVILDSEQKLVQTQLLFFDEIETTPAGIMIIESDVTEIKENFYSFSNCRNVRVREYFHDIDGVLLYTSTQFGMYLEKHNIDDQNALLRLPNK